MKKKIIIGLLIIIVLTISTIFGVKYYSENKIINHYYTERYELFNKIDSVNNEIKILQSKQKEEDLKHSERMKEYVIKTFNDIENQKHHDLILSDMNIKHLEKQSKNFKEKINPLIIETFNLIIESDSLDNKYEGLFNQEKYEKFIENNL